jgi:hypothetical protein
VRSLSGWHLNSGLSEFSGFKRRKSSIPDLQ